ncbi:MAG: glycosyltransferase family 4 protein [Moorellales bacterium]
MRVGIMGPITWRTPPRHYGPWEQVVATLAEGLVKKGVEVTVFATGDSELSAEVRWICPRPLGEDSSLNPKIYEFLHLGFCLEQAGEFDLLHNHLNCYPLVFSPLIRTPIITTLHGSALLEPETRTIYRRYRHLPYVSISLAEREGLPELNYVANVYNGLDLSGFTLVEKPGDYLLFLGRISPKKGTHLAVEVARRTGLPLVIAGYVPPDEEEYFQHQIRPQLDDRQITYIGPVGPAERNRVLGGALALLHLITVPEPFGLVLAEAQACGTPVIGFGRGSVPEVVRHGETGFVVQTLAEAEKAVAEVHRLDRRRCRQWVEENFSAEAMVEGYLAAYRAVLAGSAQ